MKKILSKNFEIFFMLIVLLSITACSIEKDGGVREETVSTNEGNDVIVEKMEHTYINPEGDTLETRVNTPESYKRTEETASRFQTFLREYPLKEDGSPILLYDGEAKFTQSNHVAVFKLPIENEDLQQCADSVMRMYAEYYFSSGQYEKISFHLSDGFEAKYTKWRDGYRIGIENDKAYWKKSAEYDDSYETFVKYMRIVFAYAGTFSMESEAEEISLKRGSCWGYFFRRRQSRACRNGC